MTMPAFALSLFVAMSVGSASAPRSESPWAPFIGCWRDSYETTTGAEARAVDARNAMTCILPVQGDPLSADVVVLANGAEQRRSRLRADGTSEGFAVRGCSGSETARFSLDGTRVLVRGEVACADKPIERIAAIFAITARGSLLHVQGRDDETAPRALFRSLDVVESSSVPPALRDALLPFEAEALARRHGISLRAIDLDTDALTETARGLPPAVTEIWLAAMISEGTAPPRLDDAMQEALRGAGVPSRVVALLEAFADPAGHDIAFSSAGAATSRTVPSGGPVSTNSQETSRDVGRSSHCAERIGMLGVAPAEINLSEIPAARVLSIGAECPGAMSLETVLRASGAYQGSLDAYARNPSAEPMTPTGDVQSHPTPVGGPASSQPRELGREPRPSDSGPREVVPSKNRPGESPRSEPTRREPARSEPVRREPVRSEPSRSEPVQKVPAPAPVRRPDPESLNS